MDKVASISRMIYNVYHKGDECMSNLSTISKWGNSMGIRIPLIITENLDLKVGDKVSVETKDGGIFIKKEQSTVKLFEDFYGKPFSEITQDDLELSEIIDWGEDVGGEVF